MLRTGRLIPDPAVMRYITGAMPCSEAETGWWLARQYWGCGLATEAARWPLRDAFERVGLERVVSVAMVRGWCSMGCRGRNTRKR